MKIKIISIEPREDQYLRAVVKQFLKKTKKPDTQELKDNFDIVEGSKMGGILITSMDKK